MIDLKKYIKKITEKIDESKIFNYIIIYFVMFSFLFPRGGIEISTIYKKVATCLIWISTIIIWMQTIIVIINKKSKKIDKNILLMFQYFVVIAVITFVVRGVFINGYQRLIAYPSIFLFCIINIKRNPKIFLNAINNIFILNLLLNQITIGNLFKDEYHLTFLGHVQVVSQIGILSIFSALTYWILFRDNKKKILLLIILSLCTMLITDATSAVMTAVIMAIGVIFIKNKKYTIKTCSAKHYIILGVILSIIIIFTSIIFNEYYIEKDNILSFSGRNFVWKDAISKIIDNPIYGYGIEGVLIEVFWTQDADLPGFNYAHNQLVQNLLDGGIIGTVSFTIMLFASLANIEKVSDNKLKELTKLCLASFLLVMVFESISLYCYMYIFLAIAYMLSNIELEEGEKNGNIK